MEITNYLLYYHISFHNHKTKTQTIRVKIDQKLYCTLFRHVVYLIRHFNYTYSTFYGYFIGHVRDRQQFENTLYVLMSF